MCWTNRMFVAYLTARGSKLVFVADNPVTVSINVSDSTMRVIYIPDSVPRVRVRCYTDSSPSSVSSLSYCKYLHTVSYLPTTYVDCYACRTKTETIIMSGICPASIYMYIYYLVSTVLRILWDKDFPQLDGLGNLPNTKFISRRIIVYEYYP